jgi:hypothetical protein
VVAAICLAFTTQCAPSAGGGGAGAQQPAVVAVEVPPPSIDEPEPIDEVTPPIVEGPAFPPTTVTPFAEQLVTTVEQVLRTGTWSNAAWPTAPNARPLVDERPASERETELHPILMGAALRIYFAPAPGQTRARPNGVQLNVVLIEGGLRIAETSLRSRRDSVVEKLPPWLEPFQTLASEIVAASKAGDTQKYFPSVAEVRKIAPEQLANEYVARRKHHRDGRTEVFEALANAHAIRGYAVADVVLATRGADGELYGYKLEVNVGADGQLVFSAPLIQAQRVWPRPESDSNDDAADEPTVVVEPAKPAAPSITVSVANGNAGLECSCAVLAESACRTMCQDRLDYRLREGHPKPACQCRPNDLICKDHCSRGRPFGSLGATP